MSKAIKLESKVSTARKEAEIKHVIEGKLGGTDKIDFGKAKLAVHAFVNNVDVARAKVSEQGRYKLTFMYGPESPITELRILPAKYSDHYAHIPTLSKMFSAACYVKKGKAANAKCDLRVPSRYLKLIETITQKYHMCGTVFAARYSNGELIAVNALPGVKIEFYEFDSVRLGSFSEFLEQKRVEYERSWQGLFRDFDDWVRTHLDELIREYYRHFPQRRQTYLGCAYSDHDGNYDFRLSYSFEVDPRLPSWIIDWQPDIRAKIYQLKDGNWVRVYTSPVNWNISEEFERDYFVPEENIIPQPPQENKPSSGFRFTRIGLIPIDTEHITAGYATGKPNDPQPVGSISHQPFCGRLSIFGLFAESPPVETYKVELSEADENGPVGNWQPIMDPLIDWKWNDNLNIWEPTTLGPDALTGLYRNVDKEPERDWLFHSLKIAWNSSQKRNGYYALRITGYDAGGQSVGTYVMPVIRIDNTPPEASIEPVCSVMGTVTECGALVLPESGGWIRFKVTAHDPEGHISDYSVSGTRGKNAEQAGPTIVHGRPNPQGNWTGVKDQDVDFTVNSLSPSLTPCPSVAYNFELLAKGLATNGFEVIAISQWIRKETNLVISKS